MTPLNIGIFATTLQKEERRLKDLASKKARREAIRAVTAKPKAEPKQAMSISAREAVDRYQKANPEKVKASRARRYEKAKSESQSRIAAAMAQVDATLKKMDSDFEYD